MVTSSLKKNYTEKVPGNTPPGRSHWRHIDRWKTRTRFISTSEWGPNLILTSGRISPAPLLVLWCFTSSSCHKIRIWVTGTLSCKSHLDLAEGGTLQPCWHSSLMVPWTHLRFAKSCGEKTGSMLVWWSVQKKKKRTCCFVKEIYFAKTQGWEGGRGREGGRTCFKCSVLN